MKSDNLKKLCVTSMLTAVAFLCTFIFRFKVSFLTFDFKDAIISVISLLYGPVWGIASAGAVALSETFLMGSDTGLYGMIMNFLSSGTFALTTGLVYKYNRTFKGAILSVIMSVVSVTSVMMLANIFITPHYIGATSADVIKLIPALLLPFNLAKSVINSAAVLVIYKPVTVTFKRMGLIKKRDNAEQVPLARRVVRSIVLPSVAVVVIIVAVLFLIFVMDGSFLLFKSN